jgi:hypothetical protein
LHRTAFVPVQVFHRETMLTFIQNVIIDPFVGFLQKIIQFFLLLQADFEAVE